MSVKRIGLPNKPISILCHNEIIWIGDAHGTLFKLKYPYSVPKVFLSSEAPISALAYEKCLYFGDWDGFIHRDDGKKVRLRNEMIKAIIIFDSKVYISCGNYVYILTLNLDIINVLNSEHKILSFTIYKNEVYCGMGVPFIAKIDNQLEIIGKSKHDTSILSMSGEYTGSADCKIIKQNYDDLNMSELYYKGDDWIRYVHNEYLFSEGKKIICDIGGLRKKSKTGLKSIYSHDDNVVGVIYSKGKIVSIGLDYSYCIYELEIVLTPEEEKEIEELMKD